MPYPAPFTAPSANPFFSSPFFSVIVFVLIAWAFFWKGLALWHSARRGEKVWFIVLLLLNTVGILEIVYLAFVAKIWSKPKPPEIAA